MLCPHSHPGWQPTPTIVVRGPEPAGPDADRQASDQCRAWRNRFGDCQCRPLLCFTCLGENSIRRTLPCALMCRSTATGRGQPMNSLNWLGCGLSGRRRHVAFVWRYVRFPVRSPVRRWLSPLEETRDSADGSAASHATTTQMSPVRHEAVPGSSLCARRLLGTQMRRAARATRTGDGYPDHTPATACGGRTVSVPGTGSDASSDRVMIRLSASTWTTDGRRPRASASSTCA